MAGYGTLMEVKYEWDIDSLFDAIEILDMIDEEKKKVSRDYGG